MSQCHRFETLAKVHKILVLYQEISQSWIWWSFREVQKKVGQGDDIQRAWSAKEERLSFNVTCFSNKGLCVAYF